VRRQMQEKEQAYSVFLRTESDGETDRIFARAEKKEKGFVFQKDGTNFCISYCRQTPYLRIESSGDMTYALELRPNTETKTTIYTSFGEMAVVARTQDLVFGEKHGGDGVDCEYTLDFSGFVQRHKFSFAVKKIF
ncbi:MAG TPA: DUF1934 domain-containing protein, partial [Candidatus Borkfalkia faecipullorum]|nr:DUF1934 domain-containing protein [Candidatus Borkfalkia faecipullorum]